MSDVKRIIGITVGTPLNPNKLGGSADEVYIATKNETEDDIPEGVEIAIFPGEEAPPSGSSDEVYILAEGETESDIPEGVEIAIFPGEEAPSSGSADEVYILSEGETESDIPEGVEIAIFPGEDIATPGAAIDLSEYAKTSEVEKKLEAKADLVDGRLSREQLPAIDNTLKLDIQGVLGVNTATEVEKDNTLPITAAAVHTTVGNIEILLGTI